jgi:uncharacterized protein (TIGR02118 family)
MVKLIALYRTPPDTAVFDEHYRNVHTPLVLKLPGLKRIEVSKITGAPIGETPYYLHAEMYFDTQEAMDRALASAEGRASAKDLMSFAGNIVTLFYAEVQES